MHVDQDDVNDGANAGDFANIVNGWRDRIQQAGVAANAHPAQQHAAPAPVPPQPAAQAAAQHPPAQAAAQPAAHFMGTPPHPGVPNHIAAGQGDMGPPSGNPAPKKRATIPVNLPQGPVLPGNAVVGGG